MLAVFANNSHFEGNGWYCPHWSVAGALLCLCLRGEYCFVVFVFPAGQPVAQDWMKMKMQILIHDFVLNHIWYFSFYCLVLRWPVREVSFDLNQICISHLCFCCKAFSTVSGKSFVFWNENHNFLVSNTNTNTNTTLCLRYELTILGQATE